MTSDEQLMEAYVAGDAAAFRELFERYGPILMRVMRQGVRDAEVARELVQRTFVQVHRARNDYRAGMPVRPWIVTIGRNVRRDWIRRHLRRPEGHPGELDREPSVAAPQDQVLAARDVRAVVSALPEGERDVVELHWFEGLSMAEVAELVGASRSAVKVRAHRAYKRMREWILAADVTGSESGTNPPQER